MGKRNLLICFDAFGTLFAPKTPVHQQYAEVAHSLGLGPFSESSVQLSFKEAYKKESKQNPNFGKANGMNPEQWWSNIIQNTFQPLVGEEKQLPKDLVPRLLHRFWSDEGYKLMPDVQSLFQKFQSSRARSSGSLLIGVVTNSDDRVPDILSSLGLRVSPLRYGSQSAFAQKHAKEDYDIDFTVMSFDVGHEKPDERIFKAAEEISKSTNSADPSQTNELDDWNKIYVGDEYSKDVVGAVNSGWNAVLIGPYMEVSQHSDVKWLGDKPTATLLEEFDSASSIGFDRLGALAEMIPAKLPAL